MKTIEYITNVSEKGVLSIPKKFLKELNVIKNSKIKVMLLYEDKSTIKKLA